MCKDENGQCIHLGDNDKKYPYRNFKRSLAEEGKKYVSNLASLVNMEIVEVNMPIPFVLDEADHKNERARLEAAIMRKTPHTCVKDCDKCREWHPERTKPLLFRKITKYGICEVCGDGVGSIHKYQVYYEKTNRKVDCEHHGVPLRKVILGKEVLLICQKHITPDNKLIRWWKKDLAVEKKRSTVEKKKPRRR